MAEQVKSPQDIAKEAPSIPVYVDPAHTAGFIGTAWAKVKAGVVEDIKVVQSHLPHPFADHEAEGGRVINVTSVPCGVGYVVDTHGNVAPPPVVTADAQMLAPSMPAPGAQAAAVQAGPVADKAISNDEMNERHTELVEAAKEAEKKPEGE